MPSPNTNYDDITATTIESRSGELADNVTDNTALLSRLKKKGNVRLVSGGDVILQELAYAENSNLIRYSGLEVLPIGENEEFTAAQFNWKQAACPVVMSGLDQLKNSGKERFIDLMEARLTNAERTLINGISSDSYSSGTSFDGKQIGGLQLLISDSPATGIVGGIDAAAYTFWRNIEQSAPALSATTIQAQMYALWPQLVRNSDSPDLIVADNNYWSLYQQSLTANQRFTDASMAELGFHNVMFQGAPVVLDGGQGGSCPANHMYFINTDYLTFVTHSARNFVPIGGKRFSTNQDAMVQIIGWAGNMTVSNRSLQGSLNGS
jgi:hypothetical protein